MRRLRLAKGSRTSRHNNDVVSLVVLSHTQSSAFVRQCGHIYVWRVTLAEIETRAILASARLGKDGACLWRRALDVFLEDRIGDGSCVDAGAGERLRDAAAGEF